MALSAFYPSTFDFAGSPDLVPSSPGSGAIYGLYEPDGTTLRYIGQTRSPAKRLWSHCNPRQLRKRTHKNQWVKSLLAQGLRPAMRVLLWVAVEHLDDAERAYIAEGRRRGLPLTNDTDGGNGVNGYVPSVEQRLALSARMKGTKLSPEHCQKVSAAVTAQWQDPHFREQRLRTMVGRRMSEEGRAKLSARQKGKTIPPEQRAKMSRAQKGRKHTPESIERMRAAQKGKVISAAQRERLRTLRLGTTLSPEHRAAIAAGLTGFKRPPMSAEQRALRAERGTGRKQSAETVHKRVQKVRATWARKRALAQAPAFEAAGLTPPAEIALDLRPLRERDPVAYHAARSDATRKGHATRRERATGLPKRLSETHRAAIAAGVRAARARQGDAARAAQLALPLSRSKGETPMTNTVDPTLPQAPPLPGTPALPDIPMTPGVPGTPPDQGSTGMPQGPQEQPDQQDDPLVPHPEQWTNTDVPADAPTEQPTTVEPDQA